MTQKNAVVVIVRSQEGLNQTQNKTGLQINYCFVSKLTNPINKAFIRLIYLKFNFCESQNSR